jgi:hypothetical protein
MNTVAEDEDVTAKWLAVRDKFAGPKKKKTAGERATFEGHAAPRDGRAKRRTGRDQQFNLKVTPAFKAEVHALAKARGVGAAELLETILAEWKAANA